MNGPLLTLDVVILCYNEENEIGGCLDALLVQRDQIERIIVVDNNSTDKSKAIIEQHQSQYPDKIHYVLETSQGIVPARNRGLAEARAAIVARIDADTRVSATWAVALREFYSGHPEAVVGVGAVEYYDLPARRLAKFITWLFVGIANKLSSGSVGLYGANMSIRRDIWNEIKGNVKMNSNIMEDLSIGLALGEKGYKASYIPAAFAKVSGRRLRTSPRQFAKYNAQWPRTYTVYGKHFQAATTWVSACIGIAMQVPAAFLLQYHDGKTGKFSLRKVSNYEERRIP